MGAIKSRKRMLFISLSQLFFCAGFSLVAASNNLYLACAGATLAAIGGPIGDVMLMLMMQTDMPRADLGKVYSLRQFVMYLGGSIGLMLAPFLYKYLSPHFGIGLSAAFFGILGIIGLAKFGLSKSVVKVASERESAVSSSEPVGAAQK